ncbi:MAG: hypothetical protein HY928_06240 [Elusimicrobia bacterium]|nr:hypothetical protein [Elusimicrobiota bacterium]
MTLGLSDGTEATLGRPRLDAPSAAMRKRWAKKIAEGTARPVMVYVGGQWSMNVQRGTKRVMRVNLG